MSFSWEFEYPSRRMPVMARQVVATSQPLASQAGLQMLRQGGNAIDAALAAAITLTVVEPTMNGIGSDAFCILSDEEGQLHGLNASGRSPASWTPERFASFDSMPQQGWDAVTVPGCVSAWVALSERFGSLPFADLFQPAIGYARDGWLVPPVVAASWTKATSTYRSQPDWQRAFLRSGTAPVAGELFQFEEQAKTLELIAASKGESFYRGELAAAIAAHAAAGGGAMTTEDLASHEPEWVTPLSMDYKGRSLHEIPPSGQGITAQIALGILRHFDLAGLDPDGTRSLHLQIEAMKLAYADAKRYVSDPATRDIDPQTLLEDDYLQQRARLIDPDRAIEHECGVPGQGETVYLTTADAQGRMVSFIQSNFSGFGSGIVIPGTGISMQNRGSGFTLEAGHPNQVGGGKKPYHTIIPAFVTQDARPLMSYGVMGGHMQPQGHAQMMTRIFDSGQNPQSALDAPRWRFDTGLDVAVEQQMSDKTKEGLRKLGHHLSVDPPSAFGGGQIIYRLDDGYCAASEPRKDGQAVGI